MSFEEAVQWLRAVVKNDRWRRSVPSEIVTWIETSTDEQLAAEPLRAIRLAGEAAAFAHKHDLELDTAVETD